MAQPLVSVVMLCWNRKEDVRESLSRIMEIDYPSLEVIVVDNASTDGTADMVKAEFPSAKIIRMAENRGVAAYNDGFEAASGEYIVILDDDSFPGRNAIHRMVEKFEKDPRLGVVAFDVRNYEAYDQVTSDEAGSAAPSPSANDYLMSFNGAGAGVRKSVFRSVGYYPAEFFLYYNELDAAIKIHDAGYGIEFFADVVAYHKYSPVNRASWRAPFYHTRNAFWFLWKNYPIGMALKETIRLCYLCFYYSMEQKTTVYLKAMGTAFGQAGQISGKRRPVRKEVAARIRAPHRLIFTFYR
ncbi:MAG TPA: glycosyltransferase family 2 protein [Paenibacillus sp.]|uniref:glycosyltransferase family 2 protein n=1 Tax=Paenibacillus sp. TaxID=58172 RepID=UPI002B9AA213|nr:glycosyltransferase family 2 protein [Paenibacillus sp.]HUC91994.1 glycosyltransferase family 2 protein [Paenibacillus sp.]